MDNNGLMQFRYSDADAVSILQLSDDHESFEQWKIFCIGDNRVIVEYIGTSLESKRLPLWIHLCR
jgi:hypothetical protein